MQISGPSYLRRVIRDSDFKGLQEFQVLDGRLLKPFGKELLVDCKSILSSIDALAYCLNNIQYTLHFKSCNESRASA
jgi:hypothetical protein